MMPVRSLLAVRVAEDEAVFPAVLHQPLLHRRGCLPLVQLLIAGVHNVHCQTQFVLTGAGTATTVAAFWSASSALYPGGHEPLDFAREQGFLLAVGTVGGADDRSVPRRPAGVHHGLQGWVTALVDGLSAPQVGDGDGVTRWKRRPRVDQSQIPVGRGDKGGVGGVDKG